MRQYIYQLFEQTGSLEASDILLRLLVSLVIAIIIYFTYWLSHDLSVYSRRFNVSLVVLTVLTTTVMLVIGNNIVLSLGMVGALSIVRYRTAIKDPRDTVFIFWTIIVGICCGVGDFIVASLGSFLVFLILLFFGRLKNDDRVILVIRASRSNEKRIEAVVFQYFMHKANLKAKNTGKETVEYIYEMSKKTFKNSDKEDKSITDAIYEIGNVDYVNIIAQNEDISG
ncbi:MAG: DUF4956 domain-containing protein [Clostridia bacterium]|jgi:uncharacterized membrane protein YhiD involved in acid resistance